MKDTFLFFTLIGFAAAQLPAKFTSTGSMTTARFEHTATLLNDGKVLIAGGAIWPGTSYATSSAELYDPSTGVFTATENMLVARGGHAATLLPNGNVLIVGGNSQLPDAEIYNPATRRFTSAGNMITAQRVESANLLRNGKVLIAGYNHAELYDLATGTFALTGPYLADSSLCCTAPTLLSDGKVLFPASPSAQLYDPVTGSFSLTGSMVVFYGRAATLLWNGKVLITGGGDLDAFPISAAELYDESTGTFNTTNHMLLGRFGHSATKISDGTVLIAGGNAASCLGATCFNLGPVTSAEIYDTSGAFATTSSMTTPRSAHGATLLSDGRVLITGGFNRGPFSNIALSSAEIYTSSTSAGTASTTYPRRRTR